MQTITPHGLRHTCASLAVSSGANVVAGSRMLGQRIRASLFGSTPICSTATSTRWPSIWTRKSRRVSKPCPKHLSTVAGNAKGVTVWFSEENIGLVVPFMRAIDKGLSKSRAGIVLVTPALLKRLPTGGVADKELSELLARDLLIPIVHETTYEALREESPLLASRNGLDTADDSMEDIAIEISELVNVTGLVDA